MTDKIKALFFANYLGQKYINTNQNFQDPLSLDAVNIHGAVCDDDIEDMHPIEECILLLRSIEQLNDKEAIQCAQCGFDYFNCITCDYELKVVREIRKISVACVSTDGKTCLAKIEISNEWKLNISQIDYLRSIGILLPFTYLDEYGKPKTLTPTQIVNAGWVKLKTT